MIRILLRYRLFSFVETSRGIPRLTGANTRLLVFLTKRMRMNKHFRLVRVSPMKYDFFVVVVVSLNYYLVSDKSRLIVCHRSRDAASPILPTRSYSKLNYSI